MRKHHLLSHDLVSSLNMARLEGTCNVRRMAKLLSILPRATLRVKMIMITDTDAEKKNEISRIGQKGWVAQI